MAPPSDQSFFTLSYHDYKHTSLIVQVLFEVRFQVKADAMHRLFSFICAESGNCPEAVEPVHNRTCGTPPHPDAPVPAGHEF